MGVVLQSAMEKLDLEVVGEKSCLALRTKPLPLSLLEEGWRRKRGEDEGGSEDQQLPCSLK